jgi:hypothetical protein
MSAQHQALKLLVQGDLVAVQPAAAKGAAAETLSVQLSSGKVCSCVLLNGMWCAAAGAQRSGGSAASSKSSSSKLDASVHDVLALT